MAFIRSFFLLAVVAFSSSSAFWDWFSGGPRLNTVRVTFAVGGYNELPTRRSDAEKNGWKLITKAEEGCTNGGKYNGFRYIYQDDSSISLLVDVTDNVVGIQMNINKTSVATPENKYKYEEVPFYVNDVINGLPVWTLTAYFVDPSIICKTGRGVNAIANEGTATGVFLQNGAPDKTVEIPYNRADAINTGWTENNCFPGMGYHNFFQSEKYQDSNCTTFRPAFGLYQNSTSGFITGFGLTSVGKAYSANKRYENPSSGAIKLIVGKEHLSQCLTELADSPGVTTMHVFFTNFNRAYTCL